MTKRHLTAALSALLLLLLGPAAAHAFKRTRVGDPIKDFSLPVLSGGTIRLSEQLGSKATLLVFWATWSPRSAEALDDYQQVYTEHGKDGLAVVAVNVEHQELDSAGAERVAAFVGEHRLSFPVAVDEGLGAFNDYGVIAVPSTALLGPEGQVVELLEGYSHMTRDGFREAVLRTLGILSAPSGEERAETEGRQPAGKAARYAHMGDLLLKREMPAKAERAFRQAVSEDPEWAGGYRGLALSLEAQGKADEAAEARRRSVELAGASPESQGALSEAQPEREGAGSPGFAAERYLRMGSLLLQQGMPSAAEDAFQKAVAASPDSPEGYRKLAEALEAQGKAPEAAEARGKAVALETAGGRPDQRRESHP